MQKCISYAPIELELKAKKLCTKMFVYFLLIYLSKTQENMTTRNFLHHLIINILLFLGSSTVLKSGDWYNNIIEILNFKYNTEQSTNE